VTPAAFDALDDVHVDEAPVDEAFITALRVGVMRLGRRLRRERDPADLTLSQLAVLGTLELNGPCTLRRLAEEEKVSAPSMTRIVNRLVETGLVVRRAHGTDGRQVVITMTEAAEQLLESNRQRRNLWLAEQVRGLDADQRVILERALPLLELLAQR
jgi:DNA-binding MarR family transcriptional regulator